jgi:predicted alpha/beta hydrolase family esterase
MMQASAGLRRSDEIRALVVAVDASGSVSGIDPELVTTWKRWVLEQVDRMDLRSWSAPELEQWLEAFNLRPASKA